MHPLAFGAILLFAGQKLEPADVGASHGDAVRPHHGRGATAAVGTLLAVLVGSNWDAIVAATRSLSAAAQGLTASVGLALLGLTLLYAGRGRQTAS